MKDFAGKTAFVTGGASGIGLGIAKALLADGANVVIADIRQDHLDAAVAEMDGGDRVLAIQLDVTDRAAYKAAADKVETTIGKLHVLINTAGVAVVGPTELATHADFDWLLGVNLHGVINGVQTFVPRMIELGQGDHVCNTASMAAFIGSPIPGIYNTTKFAVRGLSESLRWSLMEHNISVSMLCPGLVKSYIYASDDIRPDALKGAMKPVDSETVKRLESLHEFGMEPDEIACRTLEAIKAHWFYIFSHRDHKEELRGIFNEIIDAYVDYPQDAGYEQRVGFEKFRQERAMELRRKWNELG
ncbi:MAG: SDR family NAD(P)-dependent oxidoreductase [Sphingomonadaceae bacterium]|nr:SDR family NAD(P)-dependent oxidoreductase [Sphingomonadaceae bacterium]